MQEYMEDFLTRCIKAMSSKFQVQACLELEDM